MMGCIYSFHAKKAKNNPESFLAFLSSRVLRRGVTNCGKANGPRAVNLQSTALWQKAADTNHGRVALRSESELKYTVKYSLGDGLSLKLCYKNYKLISVRGVG